jgi:hypothetical protein
MNVKMSKEDKIAFNFATFPNAFKNPKSLVILQSLEKKHSENRDIKRKIVNFYESNGKPLEAAMKLLFLVRKHMNENDISKLIFLAFKSGFLELIFYKMNQIEILKKDQKMNFYVEFIEMFSKRKPKFDFEQHLANNPLIQSASSTATKCEYSKSNYLTGRSENMAEYSYKFNENYNTMIDFINLGRFKDFILLAESTFKFNGSIECIDFLIKHQKLELLFNLHKKSIFFTKYYLEAIDLISADVLMAIEISISIKSIEILSELSNLLQVRIIQSIAS